MVQLFVRIHNWAFVQIRSWTSVFIHSHHDCWWNNNYYCDWYICWWFIGCWKLCFRNHESKITDEQKVYLDRSRRAWVFFKRFGQIHVDRSCSVIWSIVGAVCPAWSSCVENACSSQYFDSLFAYSLLGCCEMLSSGRSIFHCSSWGQVEELNVLMRLWIGL